VLDGMSKRMPKIKDGAQPALTLILSYYSCLYATATMDGFSQHLTISGK
jgi:hypothetical protein